MIDVLIIYVIFIVKKKLNLGIVLFVNNVSYNKKEIFLIFINIVVIVYFIEFFVMQLQQLEFFSVVLEMIKVYVFVFFVCLFVELYIFMGVLFLKNMFIVLGWVFLLKLMYFLDLLLV